MKKINIDIPWTRIIIEFFSIIFAVFLALLVDQRKEENRNHKMAERALNNIVSETQKNYDSLLAYHTLFNKRIKDIDSLINLAKHNKPFNIKGYQFMTLYSTAWETAKLTQVFNYMDFVTVGEISDVYNNQQLYTGIVQKIIDDMIFSANINTLKEAATLLQKHRSLFISINMIEGQLLESYKKFLHDRKVLKE